MHVGVHVCVRWLSWRVCAVPLCVSVRVCVRARVFPPNLYPCYALGLSSARGQTYPLYKRASVATGVCSVDSTFNIMIIRDNVMNIASVTQDVLLVLSVDG